MDTTELQAVLYHQYVLLRSKFAHDPSMQAALAVLYVLNIEMLPRLQQELAAKKTLPRVSSSGPIPFPGRLSQSEGREATPVEDG